MGKFIIAVNGFIAILTCLTVLYLGTFTLVLASHMFHCSDKDAVCETSIPALSIYAYSEKETKNDTE